MGKTSIEWAEHTWNPIRGCSMAPGSEKGGCLNCYAARMSARNLPGMRSPSTGQPFAVLRDSGPRWTGVLELIPERLDIPLRRRMPTTYFVNSMSDLFHETLPDAAIGRVFAVMALCPQHRFICLTKRAERMADYCEHRPPAQATVDLADELGLEPRCVRPVPHIQPGARWWPLPNVILGVSCEDQATADDRIPHLLATPAACRMVSLEPLLGPINLYSHIPTLEIERETRTADDRYIDWVIVGGESGPGARPMHIDWARSLRDQCAAAGVPYFMKQWGEWMPIFAGINPSENDPRCRIHEGFTFPREDGEKIGQHMWRVGKKAAGRLLDGRVWDERPDVLEGAK